MKKDIDLSDFKNFEILDYEQKLKLCILKYNFDTLVISINDTNVNSCYGFKLSNIPFDSKIHTLHPKSISEEKTFIKLFEENAYFRELKYSSDIFLNEFEFLKEYWIGRIEIANLKEELYEEELNKIRSLILLENRNIYKPSFQSFFELGIYQYKIGGGMNSFYFWQMYYNEWGQNREFVSLHTLTSVLRLYYQGYDYGQYYNYLKNFNLKEFTLLKNESTLLEENKNRSNSLFEHQTHIDNSHIANEKHLNNNGTSLAHRAIAMLYYYLDEPITDNNAHKYAQKHGQGSGNKLMENFRNIKNNRLEILNHKYSKKYFEAIEAILRKTAQKEQIARMEKDFNEVKNKKRESF